MPLLLVAALTAGCARPASNPGAVTATRNNPLLAIGVGSLAIGDAFWRVWYIIDRATQTCWIKLGESGAGMDCCQLRLVAAARSHITWENDVSCAASTQAVPAEPAAPGPAAAPTL